MSFNWDGTVRGTPEGVRVFPIDGVFVVADPGGWLDGEYAMVEAAVAASPWGAG